MQGRIEVLSRYANGLSNKRNHLTVEVLILFLLKALFINFKEKKVKFQRALFFASIFLSELLKAKG